MIPALPIIEPQTLAPPNHENGNVPKRRILTLPRISALLLLSPLLAVVCILILANTKPGHMEFCGAFFTFILG